MGSVYAMMHRGLTCVTFVSESLLNIEIHFPDGIIVFGNYDFR